MSRETLPKGFFVFVLCFSTVMWFGASRIGSHCDIFQLVETIWISSVLLIAGVWAIKPWT